MDLPAVFRPSRIFTRPRLLTAAAAAAMGAAALVATSGATTSPTARACPTAAIVKKALGQAVKTPVATTTAFSKTCTYPLSGTASAFWTKITFQEELGKSSFLADENAVKKAGLKPVNVEHLGQAAWTTGTGDPYVYDGSEQIKILALGLGVQPKSNATAKVEALARALL